MSRWSVAAAATVGERHIAEGRPCEDAWVTRIYEAHGETWLILAVADGAGSAGRAQAGSALAVSAFAEAAARCIYSGVELTSDCVRDWLGGARVALALEAGVASVPMREYATTLLGAVIGPRGAAFAQVGDGAIVLAGDERGSWAWMFEPQKGEYANETAFLTDEDAVARASAAVVSHAPAELALFTDGLENLLIRTQPERHVVGKFFEQMFPPVRRANQAGLDDALCDHLAGYLATPQIAARSDDDRTLILATCLREAVESAARETETCATA
jgi:hypothetical protein